MASPSTKEKRCEVPASEGPGRLGGSGEADESVVLADVETAARIYAETARAWSP